MSSSTISLRTTSSSTVAGTGTPGETDGDITTTGTLTIGSTYFDVEPTGTGDVSLKSSFHTC